MIDTAVGRTSDCPPALAVEARRRALSELADLYAAEQSGNDRPLTVALPSILPPLCRADLSRLDVLDFFDQFARARAVDGRADSTYDEMARAESHAERLLDQLVGGSA